MNGGSRCDLRGVEGCENEPSPDQLERFESQMAGVELKIGGVSEQMLRDQQYAVLNDVHEIVKAIKGLVETIKAEIGPALLEKIKAEI